MTVFNKIDAHRDLVVGVGSALIDILVHEKDDFVKRLGPIKGGMTYVDSDVIDKAVARSGSKPPIVPGGSACNTTVGIGQLGGRVRFVGKSGTGKVGKMLRADLVRQNVEPWLFESDLPTGRVLSVITPDAQRSMFTYLGASAEIQPEQITPACFLDAAIVHIEGYLIFNKDLFASIVTNARDAGALISLDLASFNVVEESKAELTAFVERDIDILIANEDEALAYTGIKDESDALDAMAEKVDIAVLKKGIQGSMIAYQGDHYPIALYGDSSSAVDTTGAGDLWVSGFLYGLLRRMPLEQCGALASRCGHAVCQVVGANIAEDQWEIIRKSVEEK